MTLVYSELSFVLYVVTHKNVINHLAKTTTATTTTTAAAAGAAACGGVADAAANTTVCATSTSAASTTNSATTSKHSCNFYSDISYPMDLANILNLYNSRIATRTVIKW